MAIDSSTPRAVPRVEMTGTVRGVRVADGMDSGYGHILTVWGASSAPFDIHLPVHGDVANATGEPAAVPYPGKRFIETIAVGAKIRITIEPEPGPPGVDSATYVFPGAWLAPPPTVPPAPTERWGTVSLRGFRSLGFCKVLGDPRTSIVLHAIRYDDAGAVVGEDYFAAASLYLFSEVKGAALVAKREAMAATAVEWAAERERAAALAGSRAAEDAKYAAARRGLVAVVSVASRSSGQHKDVVVEVLRATDGEVRSWSTDHESVPEVRSVWYGREGHVTSTDHAVVAALCSGGCWAHSPATCPTDFYLRDVEDDGSVPPDGQQSSPERGAGVVAVGAQHRFNRVVAAIESLGFAAVIALRAGVDEPASDTPRQPDEMYAPGVDDPLDPTDF